MYSPKIEPRLVVQLYRLKQATGQPMTRLVNTALEEMLSTKHDLLSRVTLPPSASAQAALAAAPGRRR